MTTVSTLTSVTASSSELFPRCVMAATMAWAVLWIRLLSGRSQAGLKDCGRDTLRRLPPDPAPPQRRGRTKAEAPASAQPTGRGAHAGAALHQGCRQLTQRWLWLTAPSTGPAAIPSPWALGLSVLLDLHTCPGPPPLPGPALAQPLAWLNALPSEQAPDSRPCSPASPLTRARQHPSPQARAPPAPGRSPSSVHCSGVDSHLWVSHSAFNYLGTRPAWALHPSTPREPYRAGPEVGGRLPAHTHHGHLHGAGLRGRPVTQQHKEAVPGHCPRGRQGANP